MGVNSVSGTSTLLDMLNSSSTSSTDDIFTTLIENNNLRCENRLSQLGITSSSSSSSSYEKVSASASNVSDAISKLNSEELWNEDSEDFDRDNVNSAVKEFVSAYNTFLTNISNVGNSIEKTFKNDLSDITDEYAERLQAVGVTVGSDGKLSVDNSVLNASELSELKNLFGTDSEFLGGVDELAGDCSSIVSKALTIQNSMSSLYNSSSGTVDLSSYLSGSAFDSIG